MQPELKASQMSDYNYTIQDTMEVAERKAGNGWKTYKWQAAGRDNVLTGRKPGGLFTRGPRKGKPNYRHKDSGPISVIVVSEAELFETAKRYEDEIGKCWNCKGHGEGFAGWSAKEGVRLKPCKRCSATGSPQPRASGANHTGGPYMSQPETIEASNTPSTPHAVVRSQDAVVRCTICGCDCKLEDAKHLAIYVIGSEGVIACLECRIALTRSAEAMMRVAGKARIDGFRDGRRFPTSNPAGLGTTHKNEGANHGQ